MRIKIFVSLCFLLFTISCATKKNIDVAKNLQEGIVYVFPSEVQSLLESKIQSEQETVYLVLESINFNEHRIYFCEYNKNEAQKTWIKNTNRQAFVFGKLYPLIFKYDEFFSTPMSTQDYLNSVDSEGSYNFKQIYTIRDNVYHIDFTTKGKILYEGY